ncbi:MAG TPA: histidine kinase [Acidimicrobiales bacterium]|nr:histidine kinase [Acidimicrobiales bacterium]
MDQPHLRTNWLTRPLFGVRDVGAGDVGLALLLSVFGIALVTGWTGSSNHGGAGAAAGVLLMTAPVVIARRQPLLAAGLLAAGAGLNWALFDNIVRCGAALPAVFYVGFVVGSRTRTWSHLGAGFSLLVVALICQSYSDPQLAGPGVLVLMVPVTVSFIIAGRLLRARTAAVARLRAQTAELREQREQTARIAVAADQARIAADLEGYLHDKVQQMAASASTGSAALVAEPGAAEDAFVAIQGTGRETLTHMREVVADLRDQAGHGASGTSPQPVLAQLDRLLSEAAGSGARLQVTGDPRLLPPGLELSGYRIVEHLLVTMDEVPGAPVDVKVAFGPETLTLTVAGPSRRPSEVRSALAAARERAALYGGSLQTQAGGGRRETVVLLPLAAGLV